MEKDIIATHKITKKIHGWLTKKEGIFLYNQAKSCSGKGVILEIGSWKGKSTIWLARGSKAGNNIGVFTVDTYKGSSENRMLRKSINTYEELIKNLKKAGASKITVPIVKTSQSLAKEWKDPIEFLFIDGSHKYKDIENDFLLFFPYLVDGGTIAIHDTTSCIQYLLPGWPGPKSVAEKYLLNSDKFNLPRSVDTIMFAEKNKERIAKSKKSIYLFKLKRLIPDLIHIPLYHLLIFFMTIVSFILHGKKQISETH